MSFFYNIGSLSSPGHGRNDIKNLLYTKEFTANLLLIYDRVYISCFNKFYKLSFYFYIILRKILSLFVSKDIKKDMLVV